MTQKETILQILNEVEWVCGIEFQQKYIPEYRTRINEIRKDGFTVEARRCTQHPHRGIMQEWSLRTKASQAETPKDDINPVQEITPVLEPSVASQPKARGWSYYPPEPLKVCCSIAKASKGYMHAQGCRTQK